MSSKMQGKQPMYGRKRSHTQAPARAHSPVPHAPSPPHKRDLASYAAHQDSIYLDAIWGDQMRQLCTENDNQVHIARVPSAYRAMLAPPNPPLYAPQKAKHVRFASTPNAVADSPAAAMTLVGKAQSLWRQVSGGADDTYGLLPK